MKKLLMKSRYLFFEQDIKELIKIKIDNLIDDCETHSRKEIKLRLISLKNLMNEFNKKNDS